MRKSHFPDPAALPMAVCSCHRTFARAVPRAESAPPWACLGRACAWTTAWGPTTGWARNCGLLTHQEPVEVHEGEQQKESVEEEVEGDVRHGAQAAVARGVQNLEREPVEAEPEPAAGRGAWGSCRGEAEGCPTWALCCPTWTHPSVPAHPHPSRSPCPLLAHPCPSVSIPTQPCFCPASGSPLSRQAPQTAPGPAPSGLAPPLRPSPTSSPECLHPFSPAPPPSLPPHQLRLKLRQPRSAARAWSL